MRLGYRKKCDKCGAKSTKKRYIYGYGLMRNAPYYNYMGFDLCENCLRKFKRNMSRWIGIKWKTYGGKIEE